MQEMNTETLYRKEGRKYVAVAEGMYGHNHPYRDIWPEGTHLLVCRPSGRSVSYNINNDPGLLGTATLLREKIVKMLGDSMTMQPSDRNALTEHQLQKYNEFIEAMGNDRYSMSYPSLQECAENVVKMIIQEHERGRFCT